MIFKHSIARGKINRGTRRGVGLIGFMMIAMTGATTIAANAPRTRPTTQPRAVRPPAPSLRPVQDDPALPRVLIIGDSISMGYTLAVREKLAGKANVHRPTTNCGDTKKGIAEVDQWLATANTAGTPAKKWDVIHFNWGLHDLKYVDPKGDITDIDKGKQNTSAADYEKNLRILVKKLKATGATLIWCATTPVPPESKGRAGEDELKYNEVAARVMRENDIRIDDLWAFAKPQLSKIQLPANVHYNEEGYVALAGQVASNIESALIDRKGGKGG